MQGGKEVKVNCVDAYAVREQMNNVFAAIANTYYENLIRVDPLENLTRTSNESKD